MFHSFLFSGAFPSLCHLLYEPDPLLVKDILTGATNCVLHFPPSLLCTWLSSLVGPSLLGDLLVGVNVKPRRQLKDRVYIPLVLGSVTALDQLGLPVIRILRSEIRFSGWKAMI